MSEIVLYSQKGSGLLNREVDANFLAVRNHVLEVHDTMNELARRKFLRPLVPHVPELNLRTVLNLRLSNADVDENFLQLKQAVQVALANVVQMATESNTPLGYLPTYVHVNLRGDYPGPLTAAMVDTTFVGLREALRSVERAIVTIRDYDPGIPEVLYPVDGIFWQTLLGNVDLRRDWHKLGAKTTILQWVAVDGHSFIEQDILPMYNQVMDLDDLATYPFAEEIIIGTPGIFSEINARAGAEQLANLAEQFGQLSYPENVKGFYFPIEIDPTWTNAPAVMAPLWDRLPRPLSISLYYGHNIDGQVAAEWIASYLPEDVVILFQDGCGAFDFDPLLALSRFRQLQSTLGEDRVIMILEAFKTNPDYAGVDGTYFIPLEVEEYRYRAELFKDIPTYVFDAPNYLTSEFIQRVNNELPVLPPRELKVTQDSWGDTRLSWTRNLVEGQVAPASYNIQLRDGTGNLTLRNFSVPGDQSAGIYPLVYAVEDFEFAPTFIVWRVQEVSSSGYISDFSELYVGGVTQDNSRITKGIAFLGHSGVEHMFSTMSGASVAHGAAAAFRQAYADELGVEPSTILPINCGHSGSTIDRRATNGANYWWDIEGNVPGPRLNQAVASIRASNKPVKDIYWFAGRDDAMAMTSGGIPDTSTTLDRVRIAQNAIFQHLRSQIGNDIVLWVQGQLRSYTSEPPVEWYYNELSAITKLSVDLAKVDTNIRIVSWGPEAAAGPAGYVVEDVAISKTRAHLTPENYRDNARIIAHNMATGTSLHNNAPAWRFLNAPTGLSATRLANEDIVVSWDAEPGYSYKFVNKDAVTGASILAGEVSANEYIFTRDDQVAHYGFAVEMLNFTVWAVDTTSGAEGPASTFFQEVDSEYVEPDPELPGDELMPIQGFKVNKAGENVRFSWNPSANSETKFWYQNLRVDRTAVIKEGMTADTEFIFTAAEQQAAYGFTVTYVSVTVCEYDEATQTKGPIHTYMGTPS